MTELRMTRLRCLLAAALAAATLLLYYPAGGHQFILLDDDLYVTENPQVRAGLTAASFAWAFSTSHTGNWHPLTWLSHMADVSLFGLDAGWHHRVNVFLHVLNTVLLFFLLSRATGATWRSGIVAALFAVHPLHVESVAWVAERKDLLCAMFFLLSLRMYVGYAEQGGKGRYAASLGSFLLALLSKPMAVTLPFVLLLLDFWPLGRAGGMRPDGESRKKALSGLLIEKAPYFALTLLFCAVTLYVQAGNANAVPLAHLPVGKRISTAFVAYAAYLWKTVWPSGLAVFYPRPLAAASVVPLWKSGAAFALVAAVCAAVVLHFRRRPYLAVGWFWYLGTLVPVIGLVQVGGQSMADRYTYIPLIGVFVAAVWGCAEADAGSRTRSLVLGVAAAAAVAAFAFAARVQLSYWGSSERLFEHALNATRDNWLIHNNMGKVLEREGRHADAEFHWREAMRIAPGFVQPRLNLADVLARQGRLPEAAALLDEALRIRPDDEVSHNNLGTVLFGLGDLDGAARHFREAIRIASGYDLPRFNLGLALQRQGRVAEAIAAYRDALRINPAYREAQAQLELALAVYGDTEREDTPPRPPRSPASSSAGRPVPEGR